MFRPGYVYSTVYPLQDIQYIHMYYRDGLSTRSHICRGEDPRGHCSTQHLFRRGPSCCINSGSFDFWWINLKQCHAVASRGRNKAAVLYICLCSSHLTDSYKSWHYLFIFSCTFHARTIPLAVFKRLPRTARWHNAKMPVYNNHSFLTAWSPPGLWLLFLAFLNENHMPPFFLSYRNILSSVCKGL